MSELNGQELTAKKLLEAALNHRSWSIYLNDYQLKETLRRIDRLCKLLGYLVGVQAIIAVALFRLVLK